jgi:lysophospholipase L1-like esterase
MDSLIATQERIAFDGGMAFFNTYNSMGGYNSMVTWANGKPQLAAKDYTHLNAKGAEILGTGIYNSIMFEVNKAERK